MTNRSAQGKLERVEKEFVRIGLLLQHDRELASVTTIVVGAPIRGSWWGHPLGHELFDLLTAFERGEGALSGKWVNGKITYVHRRLWPAFLTLALHGERARARGVSTAANSLLRVVRRKEIVRVDELAASGFAPARELAAAARELEERVLVHAGSIHTSTGAHTKVLQSWSRWASLEKRRRSTCSLTDATAAFTAAVEMLRQGSPRRPRVPLLAGV